MSFNASSNSTNTDNTDNDGLSGGIIWLIIFLAALTFFLSIKCLICCSEFKKYRTRVPFTPGKENYPKQPPPDIPPPRNDAVYTGDYPKQQYLSSDDPAALAFTHNLQANLDLSQVAHDREQSVKAGDDHISKHSNTEESSLNCGGDIIIENNFVTKSDGVIMSAESMAVNITGETMISLPTPAKKKSELSPLGRNPAGNDKGRPSETPKHVTTVNVSFSEPLPTISGQLPETSSKSLNGRKSHKLQNVLNLHPGYIYYETFK